MRAKSARHLVEEALYGGVDAHYGTPYPCRQEDLDFIHHHPGRNDGPFVSARQATLEIVQHNDLRRRLPSYEREALRRLSIAVHNASQRPWGPDLVIKTFLDLDVVFFGGALGGYVAVSWKDKYGFAAEGESQGRTETCPLLGHAQIYLNAKAILLGPSPFSHMFSTVLHEMCHAFEVVRVSTYDLVPNSDGHDAEFGTRIYAVDRKAKELLGLEAVADGESWPRYRVGGHRERHGARA